jgi:hypothetical protein
MLPRGRVRQQSELEFFVIFVPGAYLLRALRGLSSWSSHVRDDAPSLDGHHDVEQVVDVGERVAIDKHHVGKLARFERANLILLERRSRRALAEDLADVAR